MTIKPVQCACCPAPIAKLVRGDDGIVRLVLVARHHSDHHANVYTLDELMALWESFEESSKDSAG